MLVIAVSVLLCSFQGWAQPQSIPGLEAWQAAIQAHAQAEGRLTTKAEDISGAVPGLAAWQAQQAAVLEAEKRLLAGEIATRSQQPSDIALATTPTSIPQKTTTAGTLKPTATTEESATAAVTEEPVTDSNATLAAGFKDILKNSLAKLIEKIQNKTPSTEDNAEDSTTTEKTAAKKVVDEQFNFVPTDGDTFLDQLLRKLTAGKSAVEKSSPDVSSDREEFVVKPKTVAARIRAEEEENDVIDEEEPFEFLLPKKRPSTKKPSSLEQRLKQLLTEKQQNKKKQLKISSIFDEERTTTPAPEEDEELYDLRLDDSTFRRKGSKVGFIQEELNEAAVESERLSADLDQLLVELEEEKQRDLAYLNETFRIINEKLKSSGSIDLKEDKEFVNSVFHRFAMLGYPLREEDINLRALSEARSVVAKNVLLAAEESRRMALELKRQLTGAGLARQPRGEQQPEGDQLGFNVRNLKSLLQIMS